MGNLISYRLGLLFILYLISYDHQFLDLIIKLVGHFFIVLK